MTDDFIPTKKVKKIRESDVEAAFVARVKSLGGIAMKFNSAGRQAVPDRLVLMPGGRMSFCELKRPGETPTPAQQREHVLLWSLGFVVDVIDNVPDAKAWLPPDERLRPDGRPIDTAINAKKPL